MKPHVTVLATLLLAPLSAADADEGQAITNSISMRHVPIQADIFTVDQRRAIDCRQSSTHHEEFRLADWDEKPAQRVTVTDSSNTARIGLTGFAARACEAVLLRHDDPNAHPLLKRDSALVHDLPVRLTGDALSFTLPSHSIAFLTLTR